MDIQGQGTGALPLRGNIFLKSLYLSRPWTDKKEVCRHIHNTEGTTSEKPQGRKELRVLLKGKFQTPGQKQSNKFQLQGIPGRAEVRDFQHLKVVLEQQAFLGIACEPDHQPHTMWCCWETALWLMSASGRQVIAHLRTAYFSIEMGPGTNSFSFV
jgi:hypothetical protein